MNRPDFNLVIFIGIIIIYVIGQFLIGTYHPIEKKFVFDAPADVDFLYYGAIINSLLNSLPPENPAFAGVKLTQPFLQYYPAAILAKIFNPYNSIRILNIIYVLLFGLLLKYFFPRRYGLPLLVLFASSALFVDLNALGVDLIARGFTHVPFLILLTIVLFHSNLPLRLLSAFGASLLNGYMMLIIVPYFILTLIIEREKSYFYILISSLLGLLLATLMISSEVVRKPFYFLFTESFRLDPAEIIKHAVPFIILAFICRERKMTILLAVSIIFGSLIHYNPFFPIFLIYFSGGVILANGVLRIHRGESLIYLIIAALSIGFILSSVGKYNPDNLKYFPRYDDRLNPAIEWIRRETGSGDSFMALTADAGEMALIMQHRPVYLGYVGHLSHLGIDWRKRYDATLKLFKIGKVPGKIDYVFYGPIEKKYFPHSVLNFRQSYRDSNVTIYTVK
jgi:hypothetical protein